MNIDDPRLTAYALNELDGAERAEVEAFVNSNQQARKTVEEIRRTVAMLTAGLAKIEKPALTANQREEVLAAASSNGGAGVSPALKPTLQYAARPDRKWWARRWAVGLAAGIAIAAGTAGWILRHPSNPRYVAHTNVKWIDSTPTAPSTRPTVAFDDFLHILPVTPQFELSSTIAGKSVMPTSPVDPSAITLNMTAGSKDGQTGDAWTFNSHDLSKTGAGTVTLGGVSGAPDTRDRADMRNMRFGTETIAGKSDPLGMDVVRFYAKNSNAPQWAGDSVLFQQTNTLTLTGANSYSGGTTINGGTLVTSGAATVSGPVVVGGVPVDALAKGVKAPTGEATVPELTTAGDTVLLTRLDLEKKVSGSLQTAREALALGDKERAGVELRRARIVLAEGVTVLKEEEREEIITTIRQVETAVANGESYAVLHDNPFLKVMEAPLSTFSIDVDTASYSNVRRFIGQGQLPPPDAVRIEEMLNYFPYDYRKPPEKAADPFLAEVEVATCPWNTANRLARVAIKGKEIAHDKRPVSNLVFLIDVSGSMNEPKKLPLVKEGLKLMVNELTENDRVAMVVYAGNAGLVLDSTCADPKNKETILKAIDNLSAGGSTNGGQGIELAYHMATQHFIKGGTNRVILATDGDWNVGITDQTSLTKLIEDKAKSGVFLSILGFGYGNLKDSTLERLADKGNGHYAYIDDLKEARKVLVEEMSGTLVTIAKDVKIQVEFNPARVSGYRLIGYENRMLRKEDFNNDKIDAGEIGAGHCVTALYEIVPAAKAAPATKPSTTQPAGVDPLKYQKHEILNSEDLLTLKLRYKQPDGDTSKLIETPVKDSGLSYAKASDDFKFASAVAQYGMILRKSPHKGSSSLAGVLELADEGKGKDEKTYRADFLELVKKTKALVK